MSEAERKFPFFREGQTLDKPAGWVVYGEMGRLVRIEWNPDRDRSEPEQAIEDWLG